MSSLTLDILHLKMLSIYILVSSLTFDLLHHNL
jgi:hypothetical protein